MDQPITIGLIHGHGVDASIWDGLYADLSLVGLVLRPDFAQSINHTSIETYADDLHGRLQAAQVQKVVLIGHSMGGYIALAFAELYPDMVQALILYHSTATADDENRRMQRWQTIESLRTEGTGQFIQKQMPKMVSPDYSSKKTQALVDCYSDLLTEALVSGLEAIMGRPDRTHILRKAQFPILLVLGRDDQVLPYDKTAQLADLSSQISVATIEKAGHLSMVERPSESLQVIRAFLDRL